MSNRFSPLCGPRLGRRNSAAKLKLLFHSRLERGEVKDVFPSGENNGAFEKAIDSPQIVKGNVAGRRS